MIPSVFFGQKFQCVAVLVLFLTHANAALTITSFKIIGPNIEIVVENVPAAQELRIQAAGALDTWPKLNGATVANNGGGKFTFTAPKPAATKAFYRAISIQLGPGVDPDGDGLPTALENAEGSDFALFDTDADGFSDGTEFSLGTNPNDPSSFPSLASLPTVAFTVPISAATEGSSPHQIDLSMTPAYTGQVQYSINARSTSSAPGDFQTLTGVASVSGTTGTITLNPVDDLIIKGERLIVIDLTIDHPYGYRAAGAVSHVVRLSDNDRYWNGALQDHGSSRNFRLKVVQNGSTPQITFVSGFSDGLPVTELVNTSSQSTGVIPTTNLLGESQQLWPALNPVFTATGFAATTPDMPASSTSGLMGTVPLKRSIILTASFASPGQKVTPQAILGAFTETVSHATDPAVTYLNHTISGTFVLYRDIPGIVDIASPFAPGP